MRTVVCSFALVTMLRSFAPRNADINIIIKRIRTGLKRTLIVGEKKTQKDIKSCKGKLMKKNCVWNCKYNYYEGSDDKLKEYYMLKNCGGSN